MAEASPLRDESSERQQWFAEYQAQMRRATLAERNLAEALAYADELREAAQAVVTDLAGEMNLCAQDHPAGEMCGTCQSVLLPAYETLRAALTPAQDNNQEGS